MKERLISFETAKLAKEKGFNIDNVKLIYSFKIENEEYKSSQYGITQSLLQKWLREEHDIWVIISLLTDAPYPSYCMIELMYSTPFKHIKTGYPKFYNYEESLEKGLFEALKLIKNI